MNLSMKSVTLFAACAAAISSAQPALAWGGTGHKYINGAAVGTLPQDSSLAKFFTANKDYLVAHSSDPDGWRDTDKLEAPHHFIDLDAYGMPSAFALTNLPVVRADADKKYGHDAVEKVGTVDWTIDQWTHKLSDDMKKGDPDAILLDAAVVGHYVGDSHVPFHAALNYDGQISAQRGIHARFESAMVEMTIKPTDLSPQPAQPITDIVGAARIWSGQSLDLVPTVLSADVQARAVADAAPGAKIATFGPDGSPNRDYYPDNAAYWKTFSAICRPIALARLNAASTRLGSVWLTAWQMAGQPDLSKLKAPTPNVPVPAPEPK